MGITSPIVLGFVLGLALLGPLLLVVTWRRRPHGVPGALVRLVAVLLCQVLALGAGLLAANRAYDFYSSWNDLLGGDGGADDGGVITNDLPPTVAGQGRIVERTVRLSGKGPGAVRLEVYVWLPKQYDARSARKEKFPVVMMMPGQPSSAKSVLKNFDFAAQASAAIDSGKIKPFIGVIPPIMIDPPRDTECTDVPGGPQAESWLTDAVRNDVIRHYRASSAAADWSLGGWSTGGYCAAKLVLRHPDKFGAAFSIGGYFDALQDDTTGDLWGGDAQFRNENSPLWLMQHDPTRTVNLLIVTSKQDRSSYVGETYADSQQMIAAMQGRPGVSTLVLDRGGHNYVTYGPTLTDSLVWLGKLR